MEARRELIMGKNAIKKMFAALLFTGLWILAGQGICSASTVVLQWDAVPDSSVTGYKVYYQADSSEIPFTGTGAVQGNAPVDAGSQPSATISGLDPNRAYYFAVTAYNAAGIESSYSNIVAVPELAPPTVALSSPANNTTVGGTVSVAADASDNVGVTKLEFYVNGTLQATDTSTPYMYSWNTSSLASGTYTLMAKAYDAAGNVGSSTVTVSVVNDTTAPTVSLAAPANNASVNGTTTITANAVDNVGVSLVEFYLNGTILYATSSAPYSYSWNTTTLANGSYTLTARAYDSAGNIGQSATVAVVVSNPDLTIPTVSLTAPTNNATVSGTVSVAASASDNVGVSRVEFYVNGALSATAAASPYGFSWNTTSVANDTYTLTAKAYDAAGNVGQSATMTVNVSNASPPVTGVNITSINPVSPRPVGTSVTFNAQASGGSGAYEYQYYLRNPVTGLWSVGKAYSSVSSWTWSTSGLPVGTYTIQVWARNAGSTAAYEAYQSISYVLTTTPASSVTLAADMSSPKPIGTQITFNAKASGGSGSYEYQYYVRNPVTKVWTVGQAYGTASSWTWGTAGLPAGNYSIQVWVRNTGSTATYEAWKGITYKLQ